MKVKRGSGCPLCWEMDCSIQDHTGLINTWLFTDVNTRMCGEIPLADCYNRAGTQQLFVSTFNAGRSQLSVGGNRLETATKSLNVFCLVII